MIVEQYTITADFVNYSPTEFAYLPALYFWFENYCKNPYLFVHLKVTLQFMRTNLEFFYNKNDFLINLVFKTDNLKKNRIIYIAWFKLFYYIP